MVVDGHQAHVSRLRRHQDIVSQAADVVRAADAHRRHPGLTRLLDRQPGRPRGHHRSKPPVTVHQRRRRRLPDHLKRGTRYDAPRPHQPRVLLQPEHPVRIVPRQVRADAVLGDDGGFLGAGAGAAQQPGGDLLQLVGGNFRHFPGSFSHAVALGRNTSVTIVELEIPHGQVS